MNELRTRNEELYRFEEMLEGKNFEHEKEQLSGMPEDKISTAGEITQKT